MTTWYSTLRLMTSCRSRRSKERKGDDGRTGTSSFLNVFERVLILFTGQRQKELPNVKVDRRKRQRLRLLTMTNQSLALRKELAKICLITFPPRSPPHKHGRHKMRDRQHKLSLPSFPTIQNLTHPHRPMFQKISQSLAMHH